MFELLNHSQLSIPNTEAANIRSERVDKQHFPNPRSHQRIILQYHQHSNSLKNRVLRKQEDRSENDSRIPDASRSYCIYRSVQKFRPFSELLLRNKVFEDFSLLWHTTDTREMIPSTPSIHHTYSLKHNYQIILKINLRAQELSNSPKTRQ